MEEKCKVPRNLPNILSIIRVILVPVFVASLLITKHSGIWGVIVPTFVYILTAITDALDGHIARKYNLISEFGKFIDPLADKFMVIASQIAILAWMIMTEPRPSMADRIFVYVYIFAVVIILLRELTVTGLRLAVVGKVDLAASIFGKLKTVSQMVGTVLLIVLWKATLYVTKMGIEIPVITPLLKYHVILFVVIAIMLFTTVWSMVEYMKAYLPHIDFTGNKTYGKEE